MNVHDFTVRTAEGKEISLGDYKGKVLLLVNTASYCGYTVQLKGLERTYQALHDQGLEIIAFPANQFRDQEPDTIEKIQKTYHEEYGVTFPIMDKVLVNGPQASPLFVYLKEQKGFDPNSNTPEVMIPYYKEDNPDYKNSSDIKWNFTKFLVDKEGNVVERFEPEQTPSTLEESIKRELAK